MLSTKYINYVFDEKIEIKTGSPIFENCIFEKGVVIQGSNKDKERNPSPVFKFCTFYQFDAPSVYLDCRAQGEFYGCTVSSQRFLAVRIDIDSCGLFRDCTIRNGVAILCESSGKFENCRFCGIEQDEVSVPKGLVCLDANDGKNTFFSRCTFAVSEKEMPLDYSCVSGWGSLSFDKCSFFGPKEVLFDKNRGVNHEFNDCKFNCSGMETYKKNPLFFRGKTTY